MTDRKDRCPQELAPLLSKLLDGDFTSTDRNDLQDLLLHSVRCRRYYLRFMQSHAMMRWTMSQFRQGSSGDGPEGLGSYKSSVDAHLDHVLELIESLADPSSELHPVRLDLDKRKAKYTNKHEKPPLAAKDVLSTTHYFFRNTLRSKAKSFAAIAAMLILMATLTLLFKGVGDSRPTNGTAENNNGSIPSAVATLIEIDHVRWEDAGRVLVPGQKIRAKDELRINSGQLRLKMANGTDVYVYGPASLTVMHDDRLDLASGRLVGHCLTEESRGFMVVTEQAEVIDLGTVFSVDVSNNQTHVDVDSGAVQVAMRSDAPDAPEIKPRIVQSKTGISIAAGNIKERPYRAASMSQRRDNLGYHPVLLSNLIYQDILDLEPLSVARNTLENNDKAYLLLERASVLIDEELLDGQGVVRSSPQAIDGTILVDCYLIHYDPETTFGANRKMMVRVGFDREVVAVLTDTAKLEQTDPLLGYPEVDYVGQVIRGVKNRGLDDRVAESGMDNIVIDPDGQTVTGTLFTAGEIDQVRVLVKSLAPTRPAE